MPGKKKSWWKRAVANLKNRWVQVLATLIILAIAVGASKVVFGPKAVKANEAKDPNVFKYLHCDQCGTELAYNKELDGKMCPRCRPPKTGFFIATKESVKTGSQTNPWKWYNIAVVVESVVALGMVYYFLSRPVVEAATQFFVVSCPRCSQSLRYSARSHGGAGLCPRCKGLIRFPDEDDAVSENEHARRKEEELVLQIESEHEAE
jgi:Zn-finger nucleic acid-binding protein